MKSHRLDHTMFRLGGSLPGALAFTAAIALGSSGCLIVVEETQHTGGAGGVTTSTTGGGGLGGGLGGSGGSTSTPVSCTKTPVTELPADLAVPEGITADFAVRGRVTALATAPDGDGAVLVADTGRVVVRRYREGQWGALEAIASPDLATPASPAPGGLSLGGGGKVLVVYLENHSPSVAVCARRFDPASGWSDAELVGVGTEGWWQDPSSPTVAAAMRSNGDSLIAWTRTPESEDGLFARRWPAGGAPGEVDVLSDTAAVFGSPALALHQDGRAVVAWNDHLVTAARVLDPAAGWGPLEELGGFGWDIRVGIGEDDSTFGLWAESPDVTPIFRAFVLPAGGDFGPVQEPGVLAGTDIRLAIAPDGTAIASHQMDLSSCDYHGGALQRDGAGSFTDPGPLPGIDDQPSQITGVAAAAGGKAALGWQSVTADGSYCHTGDASLLWNDPAGGAWQGVALDPSGSQPLVAFQADGQALTGWMRYDEDLSLVRRVDLSAP